MTESARPGSGSVLLGRMAHRTATVLHKLNERLETATALKRAQRAQRALPQPSAQDRPEPSATQPRGLRELIDDSVLQSAAAARRAYVSRIVDQLLPDEARIVATLAEVGPVPLVHVYSRNGRGQALEYASLVGRVAGVTLPSLTPEYVATLVRLGIAEVGPEATDADQDYELLMADRAVRNALRSGALGKIPARTVRGTVQLTERGREVVATASGEPPR